MSWSSDDDVVSLDAVPDGASASISSGHLVLKSGSHTMNIFSETGSFDNSMSINYNFNGTEGTARVADSSNSVVYDSDVDLYIGDDLTLNVAEDSNTTIDLTSSVLSSVDNVNAGSSTGNIAISGDFNDNVIYGGAGATTLWGRGGNDTLIGGTGEDFFYFNSSDGNVTIQGAGSEDIVNLSDYSVSDLTGKYSFNDNGLSLSINGQNLFVEGSSVTQFVLSDGTYTADYSNKTFNS